MPSESNASPSGKRTKTTEITDLPDTSVSDEQGDGVKGGALIQPCISPIPCVLPSVPCIKNNPRGPLRRG